jgi:hypothetical protein
MSVAEFSQWFVSEYGWIAVIMVGVVTGLVEVLKIPIKKMTAKIRNEKLRKLANKSIIVLTFGLSFLLDYLGSVVLPQFINFTPTISFVEGAVSNLVYALAEGLISVKDATTVASKIKDTASDGKVTADEAKSVVSDISDDTGKALTDDEVEKAKSAFDKLIGR